MLQNQLSVKLFINIQNLCLYWPQRPGRISIKKLVTSLVVKVRFEYWRLPVVAHGRPDHWQPIMSHGYWCLGIILHTADFETLNQLSSSSGFYRGTALIWSQHWARLTTRIRDLVLFNDCHQTIVANNYWEIVWLEKVINGLSCGAKGRGRPANAMCMSPPRIA